MEGEEPEEAAAAEEEEEEEPEEEEEEEEGALVAPEGKVPTPEFVLVLNATDEELAEKVKTMAEADIVAEYGEDGEEGFLAKLAAWRAVDAAKPTAVDFFENQVPKPTHSAPKHPEPNHSAPKIQSIHQSIHQRHSAPFSRVILGVVSMRPWSTAPHGHTLGSDLPAARAHGIELRGLAVLRHSPLPPPGYRPSHPVPAGWR